MADAAIDAARLLADLHTLRGFGTYRTGVHRPTYSPSRHGIPALARRAHGARPGWRPKSTASATCIGRAPGDDPRLLLGSHSDTQPQAGWLDGALGVIYGLEVARARCPARGVDVVAWADEEGHYATFPGSRSFIGDFSDADIDAAANRYDARRMRDALAAAGPGRRPRAPASTPGRYSGYLEAHIEQGDDLEARRLKLGIVTTIVGLWQYRITFEGVQNHAGTTRMAIRRDAGLALVQAGRRHRPPVPRNLRRDARYGPPAGSRWSPGAPSVIPGGAEMLFQFRDADPAVLDRLEATLDELVADVERRPLPHHAAHRVAFDAAADGRAPAGRAGARRRAATRRGCTSACRAAPATTPSNSPG